MAAGQARAQIGVYLCLPLAPLPSHSPSALLGGSIILFLNTGFGIVLNRLPASRHDIVKFATLYPHPVLLLRLLFWPVESSHAQNKLSVLWQLDVHPRLPNFFYLQLLQTSNFKVFLLLLLLVSLGTHSKWLR